MTKRLLVLMVTVLFLLYVGCSSQTGMDPAQTPEDNRQPNIGGIALGDDIEKLSSSILTSNYTDVISEEEAYFGPHYIRTYQQGVILIVNKETDKILQIMSSDPSLATDLGVRIGDSYESALAKYQGEYDVPISIHTNIELIGWFQTEDNELIIFDLDKDESTIFNSEVTKDSKVERLVLAYSKFMD